MPTTSKAVRMSGALALVASCLGFGPGVRTASAQLYAGSVTPTTSPAVNVPPVAPGGSLAGFSVNSPFPNRTAGYNTAAVATAAPAPSLAAANGLVPASYPGGPGGQVMQSAMVPGGYPADPQLPARRTPMMANPASQPNASNAAGSYWGAEAGTGQPSPDAPKRRVSLVRRFFNLFDRNSEDDDGDTSNAPSAYRDPATGLNLPFPRPWMNNPPR